MPGSLSPPFPVPSNGAGPAAVPLKEARKDIDGFLPSGGQHVDSGIATPADVPSSPKAAPAAEPAAPARTSGFRTAQAAVEEEAVASSDAVFVYETASLNGFGAALESKDGQAKVFKMEDRAGAGTAVAGYLRAGKAQVVSAFAASSSLIGFLPALSGLAVAGSTSTDKSKKVVLHTPTYVRAPGSLTLSPSLASVLIAAQQLEGWTVLLSSTPAEIVANARKAYQIDGHVLHAFEGVYAARELSTLPSDVSAPAEATFHGPASSTSVLVVPSSYASAQLASAASAPAHIVLHTLNVDDIASVLPASVTDVQVWDEAGAEGVLVSLVAAALLGRPLKVRAFSTLPSLSPAASDAKTSVFLTSAPTVAAPQLVASLFAQNPSLQTRAQTLYDNFATQTGLALSTVSIAAQSARAPLAYPQPGQADFLAVELSALKASAPLSLLRQNGTLLVDSASLATPEELKAKLSVHDRRAIVDAGFRVWVVDSAAAGGEDAQAVAALVAFLLLFTSSVPRLPAPIKNLLAAFLPDVAPARLAEVIAKVEEALYEVVPTAEWSQLEECKEEKGDNRVEGLSINGLTATAAGTEETPSKGAVRAEGTWFEPAWQYLFGEAYSFPTSAEDSTPAPLGTLHPSTPEQTFLITVSENRRLTPLTYDRNVFHISFDTKGTGLKYEIGEALGVYGWNDEGEVRDFLQWYGLPEDGVVSVEDDEGKVETRSVFQTFQQTVDIFGKPPKSFYAALSEIATDRDHQRALRFISSAEGSSTFKRLSEVDTLTFADVLRKFPSAHPPLKELVTLVGTIKPRHYSIASSQAAVGDQVDLLVVTVDWLTPSGSPRYGQCTRYLAGLPVGTKVAVSIKPSVMKLPESDQAPIVMAGLGTGAAPFRAFIQHRAWQRAQGIAVGPLVYYFGARYRHAEYLYGEELEAYLQDGIVTKLGLAFSRDGPKKVYIQHKMTEDQSLLSRYLSNKSDGGSDGVFYLCGPTWPVPDVYEALVTGFQAQGKSRQAAEDFIEELKEAERYVLEVY